ncbi:MAG: pH regulation protein F [Candidatus Verstraetearchaeota archaeon]|nr:pH regulation protein F [Candidatus Verstraetearchaeota archaeon]
MIDAILVGLVAIFLASIVIAAYRLIRGPTIPDRMLALDIISYTFAVVMALVAVLLRSPFLIAISFMLALWFYVGSLYVARYLEGGEIGD